MAMTKAGLGAGVTFAFVATLLFGSANERISDNLDRLPAVAIVGFLVGVVCFIFGQRYK